MASPLMSGRTTSAARCAPRTAHAIESGWVQVNQGLGQQPGHSYGGYKQSGIGREFSLEGMLDSFTQRKNVTVNLNTPRRME
jgi:acyl-CoA reductase-like NAD-dependent aldehyde dehydrogenase